jgi:CheY-like chemotaxis protein/HPt (histidine-containing phosphotransfer) domain-containing protein
VVENGKAAVDALAEERFDVALLDVEMPQMDGLQAAQVIRAREEREGGGRVPLIVVTAYAMKGDRERCLQAGFDAYVSKPVQVDELLDAIERLAGPAPESEGREGRLSLPPTLAFPPSSVATLTDPPPQPAVALFDRDKALARAGGDEELLRELLELFIEEGPRWLADIDAAIAAGDARKLQRAAHTVKGAVDNFGAPAAFDAALRLEQMARAGELGAAGEASAALRALIERLASELGVALREGADAPPGAGAPGEEIPW